MNRRLKTQMPPEHVIFDLIGVLFNVAKWKQLAQLGLVRTAHYLLTHWKNPIDAYLQTMETLARQEKTTIKQIKFKQYKLPSYAIGCFLGLETARETARIIKDKIEQLDVNYFASQSEKNLMLGIATILLDSSRAMGNLIPNKRLISFIKTLAAAGRHQIFLLTNIETESFEYLKKKYNQLFSLFNGMVASCDIHLLKPDQRIYQHLLETHGLQAQQCVFIDDQQENLVAAQKLGITGIQYTNFETVRKKLFGMGVL